MKTISLLLLVALTGCGSAANVLRQGATVTCHAASSAYRALDKADALEQQAIRDMAVGTCKPSAMAPPSTCTPSQPFLAQQRLDEWVPKYKIAREVIDEAEDQCELAAIAADRIDAHQALPPGAHADASIWLVDLLALAPRIVGALADLGIKLDLNAPPAPAPAAGGVSLTDDVPTGCPRNVGKYRPVSAGLLVGARS